ncbi:hypothetical protein KIPB_006445, partial [Kipferlia bialata]|eukprot:g6445.t1
MTVFENPNCPV